MVSHVFGPSGFCIQPGHEYNGRNLSTVGEEKAGARSQVFFDILCMPRVFLWPPAALQKGRASAPVPWEAYNPRLTHSKEDFALLMDELLCLGLGLERKGASISAMTIGSKEVDSTRAGAVLAGFTESLGDPRCTRDINLKVPTQRT